MSSPVVVVDRSRRPWLRMLGCLGLFGLVRLGRVVCLQAQRSPVAVRIVRALGKVLGLPRVSDRER